MGDWRHNKDDEVELDGIGGVNILVKADVHRSGQSYFPKAAHTKAKLTLNRSKSQESTSHATHSKTKPRQKASPKWPKEQDIRLSGCPTTSCGISTPTRNGAISGVDQHTEKTAFYFLPSTSIFLIPHPLP